MLMLMTVFQVKQLESLMYVFVFVFWWFIYFKR